MRVATVIVERNGGPLIINKTDFREGVDKLWTGESTVAQVEEPVKAVPQLHHKGGGRWYVTVDGEHIHEGTMTKDAAQALADAY